MRFADSFPKQNPILYALCCMRLSNCCWSSAVCYTFADTETSQQIEELTRFNNSFV